jgi:hypothetical protein
MAEVLQAAEPPARPITKADKHARCEARYLSGCKPSCVGRGGLAWSILRFVLVADPGEWRGKVLDSQCLKAREGQPLLTSVTMLRRKYDILLDRPLRGTGA